MLRHAPRLLALLLLFGAARAQADDAAGRVSFTEGKVEREVAGARAPLAQGDAVAEGDHLFTAANSRAELILADGSVVRLGPQSDLTLSKLSFVPESETLTAKLHLALGKLWTHVEKVKAGGSYEVETDRAVAGVRGTEFRVDAAPEGHAIEVYEGRVAVHPVLLALNESPSSRARMPSAAAAAAAAPASPALAARSDEQSVGKGQRAVVADQKVALAGPAPADTFSAFARGRALPSRERFFKAPPAREPGNGPHAPKNEKRGGGRGRHH